MELERRMLYTFLLLGLVSLLADMTYEGARGVLGSYTRILGGALLVAGALSLGDLAGYLTRALTGGVLHRLRSPRAYWALVYLGYAINLGAVPLLALAGDWRVALALAYAERIGKGLRAPARDVILAEVTRGIGSVRGFAVHEVLDQLGAVAGPALVAWAAGREAIGVRGALALLAVPAALATVALTGAYILYPEPREARPRASSPRAGGRRRWTPLALGLGLSLLAVPTWPVLTYKLPPGEAALLYSAAMAADALTAALLAVAGGRAYSPMLAPLAALAGGAASLLGLQAGGRLGLMVMAASWGVFMGVFEVLPRAAIAREVPEGERSLAYGLLGLGAALGLAGSGLAYALILQALPGAALLLPALLALPPVVLILQARRGG